MRGDHRVRIIEFSLAQNPLARPLAGPYIPCFQQRQLGGEGRVLRLQTRNSKRQTGHGVRVGTEAAKRGRL